MTVKVNSDSPIVMVDDNAIDYLAAKRFINKSIISNNLIYFESGEDFIDHLKRSSINNVPIDISVVLMDINMPGLNGHQTTEVIRGLPEYSERPLILMLTSSNDYKDREKAFRAGANGYLEKPFHPEGYIDLFNSLV